MDLDALMQKAVTGIEWLVAVVLVVVAGLGLVAVVQRLVSSVSQHPYLGHAEIVGILDVVLVVFIVIELFRIAVAYMRHENVIPTVLEAALVAVARKLVIFEGGPDALQIAAALAMLTVAVAFSWFLLSRAKACDEPGGVRPPE